MKTRIKQALKGVSFSVPPFAKSARFGQQAAKTLKGMIGGPRPPIRKPGLSRPPSQYTQLPIKKRLDKRLDVRHVRHGRWHNRLKKPGPGFPIPPGFPRPKPIPPRRKPGPGFPRPKPIPPRRKPGPGFPIPPRRKPGLSRPPSQFKKRLDKRLDVRHVRHGRWHNRLSPVKKPGPRFPKAKKSDIKMGRMIKRITRRIAKPKVQTR